MVRGKIQMKKIENDAGRQVRFSIFSSEISVLTRIGFDPYLIQIFYPIRTGYIFGLSSNEFLLNPLNPKSDWIDLNLTRT